MKKEKPVTTWDHYTKVELSPEYIKALRNLLKAEVEMFRNTPGFDKECWYWGKALITDLGRNNGIQFTFGEKGDNFSGSNKRFSVFVLDDSNNEVEI